jgi:hypothetical protein
MADLHHHHDSSTVIREDVDREGPMTAFIVLLILAFVGFLIWLFAFSGVVFNRGGTAPTNNNVRIEQSNAPAQNNTTTTTQPSALPS